MANEQSPIFAAPVREGNTTADIGNRVDGTSDSTSEQSADDFQDGEDETSVQDDGKTQTDTGSPQDSDESSQEILEDSVQGDGQPQDDGDESKFQKLRSWWTGLSKKWKIVIGISLGLLVIGIIVGAIFGILASNDDGTESKKGDDEGEEKGNDEGDDKKEITTNRRTNYPTTTTTQKVEQVTLIPGGGSSGNEVTLSPGGGSSGNEVTLIPRRTVVKGQVLTAMIPRFDDDSLLNSDHCVLCKKWPYAQKGSTESGLFSSVETVSRMMWNIYSQTAETETTFEAGFHTKAGGSDDQAYNHKLLNVSTLLTDANAAPMFDKTSSPFTHEDFKYDKYIYGLVEEVETGGEGYYSWGSPGKCPFWGTKSGQGINNWHKAPLWKMQEQTNDGAGTIVLRKWYKLNTWARHVVVAMTPPKDAKYLYVSALSTNTGGEDVTYVGLVNNEKKVESGALLNKGDLPEGSAADSNMIPEAYLQRLSVAINLPTEAVETPTFQNDFPEGVIRPNRPFVGSEQEQAPTMFEFNLDGMDQINVIGKITLGKQVQLRPETTWMYTAEKLLLSDISPD